MSDVELKVCSTEVRMVDFCREEIGKGDKLDLKLDCGYKVLISNDEEEAMVISRVQIKPETGDRIHVVIEFTTIVKASEARSDLEQIVRSECIPAIMTQTAEKAKVIGSFVNFNIDLPISQFSFPNRFGESFN